MIKYKHTQVGYLLLIIYIVVILFIGYMNIVTGSNRISLVVLLVMLVVLVLFVTLTVTVDERMVKIHFGIGLIRKSFLLKEIESYQTVKNPWYYGWGIRYTPRGWLFNVSGFSAIELQMKNGKFYRIGTDDPEGLARAVGRALDEAAMY